MSVYQVSRIAPTDQNSLASFEGIGRSGSGTPGVYAPKDDKESGGFWSNTADFFKSDGFTNLVDTGFSFYSKREEQKAAERAADLAARQSQVEQQLAMEKIKGSQEERNLVARLADLNARRAEAEAQLQRSSSGMPGWVIPAAVGGAGLLLAFVLLRNKK